MIFGLTCVMFSLEDTLQEPQSTPWATLFPLSPLVSLAEIFGEFMLGRDKDKCHQVIDMEAWKKASKRKWPDNSKVISKIHFRIFRENGVAKIQNCKYFPLDMHIHTFYF